MLSYDNWRYLTSILVFDIVSKIPFETSTGRVETWTGTALIEHHWDWQIAGAQFTVCGLGSIGICQCLLSVNVWVKLVSGNEYRPTWRVVLREDPNISAAARASSREAKDRPPAIQVVAVS